MLSRRTSTLLLKRCQQQQQKICSSSLIFISNHHYKLNGKQRNDVQRMNKLVQFYSTAAAQVTPPTQQQQPQQQAAPASQQQDANTNQQPQQDATASTANAPATTPNENSKQEGEQKTQEQSSSWQNAEQTGPPLSPFWDKMRRYSIIGITTLLGIFGSLMGAYMYLMGYASTYQVFKSNMEKVILENQDRFVQVAFDALEYAKEEPLANEQSQEAMAILTNVLGNANGNDIRLLNPNFMIYATYFFHVLCKVQNKRDFWRANIVENFNQGIYDVHFPVVNTSTGAVAVLKVTLVTKDDEPYKQKPPAVKKAIKKEATTTSDAENKDKKEEEAPPEPAPAPIILPFPEFIITKVSICNAEPFLQQFGNDYFASMGAPHTIKQEQLQYAWPYKSIDVPLWQSQQEYVRDLIPSVVPGMMEPRLAPYLGHFLPHSIPAKYLI